MPALDTLRESIEPCREAHLQAQPLQNHEQVNFPHIQFMLRSYAEQRREGGNVSMRLVLHDSGLQWQIRFTLQYTPQLSKLAPKPLERRKILQTLCNIIDFDRMPLIRDSVTEIILAPNLAKNEKLPVKTVADGIPPLLSNLRFHTREDRRRVLYPRFDRSSGISSVELTQVGEVRELASGVHLVCLDQDEQPYVYKEIDRPLYEPGDTEILEQELANLSLMTQTREVVRLVAAVVSLNPYQTALGCSDTTVLRGLLIEHHPNGTLLDALQSRQQDRPWRRWACQIARGLDRLHRHGLTHMDLKPSNIVITTDHDAVLIDISGRAITHNWLSPEMRDKESPWQEDLKSRVQNDIWAFGKMLSLMADESCGEADKQLLSEVADQTTLESTPRLPLHDAILRLGP